MGIPPFGSSTSPCMEKCKCRKKKEESMDGGASLYFLDAVVGKE